MVRAIGVLNDRWMRSDVARWMEILAEKRRPLRADEVVPRWGTERGEPARHT